MIAKGVLRPHTMNRTEARYAQELELRLRVGEIAWWKYEGVTLKLADDTRYTPDFVVMLSNLELECHETKGFMREDARIKLKFAATQFPFRFYLAILKQGSFEVTEV